jgi:hypothetical protein
MEDVYCAVCRNRLPLDGDHVEIDAEIVYPRDRNGMDDYVMHTDCWRSISEGWMEPA